MMAASNIELEADLRPLTMVSCPNCQGDGVLIYVGGPGYYDSWYGWQPTEREELCETCEGAGEVEGCAICKKPEQDCMCSDDDIEAYLEVAA